MDLNLSSLTNIATGGKGALKERPYYSTTWNVNYNKAKIRIFFLILRENFSTITHSRSNLRRLQLTNHLLFAPTPPCNHEA
jgi:hypothetical protein